MAINFDLARHNMVEQQVRTWEVLDQRVLDVIGQLPREEFVMARYRKLAYADLALPLDHDQVMMKPVVEGRMLQALGLTGDEQVLEIGTGSGYITACLARLAQSVVSIDVIDQLVDVAERRLRDHDIENVTITVADALGDFEPHRAFDAVVVTGSAAQVPPTFKEWVKPGGRLFMVSGQSPAMEAQLMTRVDIDRWDTESLFETDLPRLIGAEDPEVFVL